jgi:hypothetical protein
MAIEIIIILGLILLTLFRHMGDWLLQFEARLQQRADEGDEKPE